QTALGDFDLRVCERLGGFGPPDIRFHESVGVDVLMSDALLAVYMNTVVSDIPAARQDAVPLRAQVLSRMGNAGQKRRPRLNPIFTRHCRLAYGRLKLHVESLCAVQCVLQSDDWRRRGFSLRMHELKLRAGDIGLSGRASWNGTQEAQYKDPLQGRPMTARKICDSRSGAVIDRPYRKASL